VNCPAVVDHPCWLAGFAHLGFTAAMAGGSVRGSGARVQVGWAMGYGVEVRPGWVLLPSTGVVP